MADRPRAGPVLATDLDGTLAHGTAADRQRLLEALHAAGDATLIYVTGRSPSAVAALSRTAALPEPDVLIADVGTSVLRGFGPARVEAVETEIGRRWPGAETVRERLAGLEDILEQDVDAPRRMSYWIEPVRRLGRREEVAAAGPSGAADPYAARAPDDPTLGGAAAAVASRVRGEVEARLRELEVDVVVSANVFLDVLPAGVHKGSTLRRVLAWLGLGEEACVVAGDSLNDLALFETGLRGIAVGNCEPALRERVAGLPSVYQASAEGVTGILEGLRHHGVVRPAGSDGVGHGQGGQEHGE